MTDVWIVLGEGIECPSEPLAAFDSEPARIDLERICDASNWYEPRDLTVERMTVQQVASPEDQKVAKLARLGAAFGMSKDTARSTAERVAKEWSNP
jgi:hypothetical protein